MDILSAATLPWLAGAREQLERAQSGRRLPHSLLLLSAPGLGAEALAHWSAALVLCESDQPRPCGSCRSCLLLKSDSHPDLHLIRVEEGAKQIKIAQVRALIEDLALKSFRGGYKVGIIETAEALNANGANAFLKTLEEPTENTLLILVARPTHRLPATVASRCLRLALRAPEPAVAVDWLDALGSGGSGWAAALALAGGAPLLALELKDRDMAEFDADMRAALKQLHAGTVDVTLLAERWSKTDPTLRVTWLENWITRRVRGYAERGREGETAERARLPAALLKPKIRGLFEWLDAARDFRRFASTGMNQQLALEDLLLRGRAILAK